MIMRMVMKVMMITIMMIMVKTMMGAINCLQTYD